MQAEEYNHRGELMIYCRDTCSTINEYENYLWNKNMERETKLCIIVSCRSGKEMVDYITRYLTSIRERKVIPNVKPGYMRELLPDTAPEEPEDWENIFNDIEKVIMPGVSLQLLNKFKKITYFAKFAFKWMNFFAQVVHWQSPHMHAYYPSLTSWPSMLGDMLADAINCVGFTWVSEIHRMQIIFLQWNLWSAKNLPSWSSLLNIIWVKKASSPACTELEMNMMDWLCKALGLPFFFLHHHPDSRGGGILQVCSTVYCLIQTPNLHADCFNLIFFC